MQVKLKTWNAEENCFAHSLTSHFDSFIQNIAQFIGKQDNRKIMPLENKSQMSLIY